MRHWINQHTQALSLVLNRLKKQWVSTLMIGAVIGVTLVIPSLIYVIVSNLSGLVDDVKKDSQISLFLSPSASSSLIQQQLSQNSNIKSFTFVSKDDALKQLMLSTKNSDIIKALDHNPLPDAFFIVPTSLERMHSNNYKPAYQISRVYKKLLLTANGWGDCKLYLKLANRLFGYLEAYYALH
jgi:cell division transport system permease protein